MTRPSRSTAWWSGLRGRRGLLLLCMIVAGVASLAALGASAPPGAAAPVRAAIRVQTSFCNPNRFCPPTSTQPPTLPPTFPPTNPPTISPCYVLGNTRICPTTTRPPAGNPVTTAPAGVVIVLDGGTPITPAPIVTTPPAPDEARIQVTGFDFGAMQVGQRSAAADLVVTNVGSIPVRFLNATPEGPYAVVGTTCSTSGVLNVRSSCLVSVQYGPTDAGSQPGKLTVTVLAPAGNMAQAGPLLGTGARSQIVIDPGSVDFGSTTASDALAPAAFSIRNTGTGPARITGLGFAAPTKDFTIQPSGCIGATIAPGTNCPFTVIAKTTTSGPRTAIVVATGAASEVARASVKMTVLRTGLAITPSPVDLGVALVGTPAVSRKATVRNVGQVTVSIAALKLAGPQAGEFVVSANGCEGQVLKPKGTCVVTIAGSPTVPGPRAATLTVTGGRKETAKMGLRMRGAQPTTTVTTKPTTTVAAVVTTAVSATAPTTPATAAPSAAPPTTAAPVYTPTLVMRPAVGRPGGVTTAIGTGFAPNAEVHLAWDGDPVVRTVTSDALGHFALPVVLLPGARIGGRYMATTAGGASPGLRAPFLVQLPTFKPPGDSGRAGSLVGRG